MNKIPFLKVGTGPKILVYLRGGPDLLLSVIANPVANGKSKQKLITADHTMYVLGYQRDLPPDTSIEQIADDFAEVIEKCIGKATIIGNSFGGLVALPLAANHPAIVNKLVLTASAYQFSPSFVERLNKWLELGEAGKILKLAVKMNDFYNSFSMRTLLKLMTIFSWPKNRKKLNPVSTAINVFRNALEHNGELVKYLPSIQAETVILGGTKDIVFSQELYQETASLIPHASLVLFPGFGHEMADEHPKTYRRELQKVV